MFPIKKSTQEKILMSSAFLLFHVFHNWGRIQIEKMMVLIQPSIAANIIYRQLLFSFSRYSAPTNPGE
jgi:hypothetical protein